ncbi:MAG: hypothetical protein M1820_008097 [Bogoriella megaspora]|nr:MAG: hypothetical protein M1820_008097 [Bogoriella megaspora]
MKSEPASSKIPFREWFEAPFRFAELLSSWSRPTLPRLNLPHPPPTTQPPRTPHRPLLPKISQHQFSLPTLQQSQLQEETPRTPPQSSLSSNSSVSGRLESGGRASARAPKRRLTADQTTMRPDYDASKSNTQPRAFSNRSSNGSSNGNAVSPNVKSTSSNHSNRSHEKSESNGYANGTGIPVGNYMGHNREQVTRILLQGLQDLGYQKSAQLLGKESGYELEGPEVAAFRHAVLNGDWAEAEAFLIGSLEPGQMDTTGNQTAQGTSQQGPSFNRRSGSEFRDGQSGSHKGSLILAEGASKDELLFILRQQKYLELIEIRDIGQALMVLRQELTPNSRDSDHLHAMSCLMMCSSAEELRKQAGWDGSEGTSRHLLLSALSRSISPSVMIPENRLSVLLDHFKDSQIANCKYHNTEEPPSLYLDHTCSADDFPLHVALTLRAQQDEVWSLAFSNQGTMLATSSKDSTVLIYDTTTWRVIHTLAEHGEGGVGYVAWSPDDKKLVSCAQDKSARVWDSRTGQCLFELNEFSEPVTTAVWTNSGDHLILGSMGVDLPITTWNMNGDRVHNWADESGEKIRVHDIALTPDGMKLLAIVSDDRIFVYDYHSRVRLAQWHMAVKMTCLSISADGKEVLVNMKDDRCLILDINTGGAKQTYEGQKQSSYVIRSCFGGANQQIIASGSEDCNVWIWRRRSGQLIAKLKGHQDGFVNAVAWHPTDPSIFATAGDDHTTRIWSSAESINTKPLFRPPNDPWRPWAYSEPRSSSKDSSDESNSLHDVPSEIGGYTISYGSGSS